MHSLFRNYMLAHMAGVIAKFRATSAMQHEGQKGTAREALAASVVRPWFGRSVEIGTGTIIDRHGMNSRLSDNVLYWPDVQPAIVLAPAQRLDRRDCAF